MIQKETLPITSCKTKTVNHSAAQVIKMTETSTINILSDFFNKDSRWKHT